MALKESLQGMADAKEFSALGPTDEIQIALNCNQPTCKPAPCRGCKPTCAPTCRSSELGAEGVSTVSGK